MSDTAPAPDRDEVVALIERYSEIGLPADRDQCDTFGLVLHEIGVDALAHEREHGYADGELVAALEVIGAAFQRVQDTDSGD